MEIGETAESMCAHTQTYEHLGEVRVHVHDLHPIYERYRDQQRFLVIEDNTWIAVSADVPAPPPVVWDYLHEPHLKARMMGAGSVTAADRLMRRGVGTMHHCAHGSMVIVHEYIDWRPFDYATHVGSFPMRLKAWVTTRLIPIDGGTRVEWRTSQMRGSRVLARLGMLAAGGFFRAEWKKTADNLRRVIDEDITSGALKLDTWGAADEALAAVPPFTGAQVVR
jgi:uncharacterized protein YndB with AHSA1/START domain